MAARKTSLRAVAPDEKPVAREFKNILEAASDGGARDLLVQMRNRIARTLDEPNCPARDQASLSKRLLEIRKEIEAMDAAAEQEAAESAEVADEAFDAEAL
jgi:hypothetical protein